MVLDVSSVPTEVCDVPTDTVDTVLPITASTSEQGTSSQSCSLSSLSHTVSLTTVGPQTLSETERSPVCEPSVRESETQIDNCIALSGSTSNSGLITRRTEFDNLILPDKLHFKRKTAKLSQTQFVVSGTSFRKLKAKAEQAMKRQKKKSEGDRRCIFCDSKYSEDTKKKKDG